MSNFQTQTNTGRAQKMVEILGHLETSAKSNRASTEEIDDLLAPVLEAMAQLGATIGEPRRIVGEPMAEAPAAPKATGNQWADAITMARECDLEAGMAAMTVLATRAEQELYERRTA